MNLDEVLKIATGLYRIPISAELARESMSLRVMREECERLDKIGPIHGPSLPKSIANRRKYGGTPVGKYRRNNGNKTSSS